MMSFTPDDLTAAPRANRPTGLLSRRSMWVWGFGALAMLIVIWTSGAHTAMHHYLADLRFSLLERPASGDVVIVAIDQKTRNQLDVTTPTRSQHAAVIDKLVNAGATRIGLDFQVDTPSSPAHDRALERALRLADGRVVLPVYSMKAPSFRFGMMYHEPLTAFAKHGDIGSVYLETDTDGMVREGHLIEPWQSGVVPTFAAAVTGKMITSQSEFLIDYSIDVGSIPRFSYADVLSGNLDGDAFKDKIVLIGSTHAGDDAIYNVPLHGTLHGIEVHALIADALARDRMIVGVNGTLTLTIAIGLFVLMVVASANLAPLHAGGLAIILAITAIAADLVTLAQFAIAFPVGLLLLAILLGGGVGILGRMNSQSETLFKDAFEARERSQLMHAVISGNFDGVVVFDEQDRVCLINPTAAQMLNWTVEAALGRQRDTIMRLADLNETGDEPRTGGVFETRIIRADGNELEVEMAITQTALLPSAARFERRKRERAYTIYTFRDVSERNEAEDSMAEAAARAMEADRLKSEFIANMSHELRVPLNSIIGFAEVIKQELFGDLGSPRYREYAKDIFASGTHLMTIIDDLLEVSKIASGKVEIEDAAIDMERMFAECMQIVRGYPNASKKILSASMRPGCPTLIADKRAMKQIIINLLSNAIKFTDEGGGIRLSAAPSANGGIEIMVSDDGIGIPPEEMHRITDAFHQIDHPAHRKSAGTGLGLHIVQSLAELHGASVAVSSTVNSGTQVRVIFPPDRNGPAENVIHLEPEKNTG